MQATVNERIDRLMQAGLDDLKAMPACTEATTDVEGRKTVLATHHEVMPDGAHKFVVQAIQRRWFGMFNRIAVAGFIVDRDGNRRTAVDRELWDYH